MFQMMMSVISLTASRRRLYNKVIVIRWSLTGYFFPTIPGQRFGDTCSLFGGQAHSAELILYESPDDSYFPKSGGSSFLKTVGSLFF